MKVLFLDIETAPLLGYVWGIWQQDIGLNQIKSDWHLLSWCAKWRGEKELIYRDQRKAGKIEDDKSLLKDLWKLLDQADVVVAQNGKAFDRKKINARMVLQGLKPPAPYKMLDTKEIAKKHFGFTSNRLEYLSEKLCGTKKSKHKKFPGFELWTECLAGNKEAWKEMEEYNKKDVVALEELFEKLYPWDNSLNLEGPGGGKKCHIDGGKLQCRGFAYTTSGKYQRYQCQGCGAWSRGAENLAKKSKHRKVRIC